MGGLRRNYDGGEGRTCSSVVLCRDDGHLTTLIVAVVCSLVQKVLGVFFEQYSLPRKRLHFDNYYYCTPIKTNTKPFNFPR